MSILVCVNWFRISSKRDDLAQDMIILVFFIQKEEGEEKKTVPPSGAPLKNKNTEKCGILSTAFSTLFSWIVPEKELFKDLTILN